MFLRNFFLGILILPTWCLPATAQRDIGHLRGTVRDPAGAVVSGAEVTLTVGDRTAGHAKTDVAGEFEIVIKAGTYLLRVLSPGFEIYTGDVTVGNEKATNLNITLNVAAVNSTVTVNERPPVSTDPEQNADAIRLGKDELKALPDDPAELSAALQSMAGPGAGPEGGEIFVDGFSGGKVPRKNTIREVRINQNPFAAEYDRPGFGRIEILTKPGTDSWHGEIGGEFEDESLNARNPFAPNRPPYQLRNMNGEVSGPLIKNRISSFTDLEREAIDNNALVNAIILGPGFAATPFQRSFVTHSINWDFGQRIDAQLNKNHTLVARFSRETFTSPHTAFGGFELPTTGWASRNREWFIRLTETAVLSPTIVNETRFQFYRINEQQNAVDPSPTVRVLDAFTSGGAVGHSFNRQARHELTNITSIVRGNQIIRTGLRLRVQKVLDHSPLNFAGTFTFTSLEQYRSTILNLPGAYPAQFTIAGGRPDANVSRWDVGLFIQDEIRFRPDLMISVGIRYENQDHISSPADFAPRISVAYSPGAGGKTAAKTVFRAGIGVFYDRFSPNLTLQAMRFNGIDQQRFVVTDPAILDSIVFTPTSVSNIPSVQTLAAFSQPQTIRIVALGLRSPFNIQTGLSVERQLPRKTTLSLSYLNSNLHRMLRSRNINAPVAGVRPLSTNSNVLQYESTAHLIQNQITLNFRSNFHKAVSLFGNYSLGFAKSDSDGAGTFPADQYDLSNEWGRASLDIRHRFSMGVDLKGPLGLGFSPFVTFRTGLPFNITTGTDINGDTLFTDRPSFAGPGESGVITTSFGTLDPTPEAGDVVIPRNYGRGPTFFGVNLAVRKEIRFGAADKKAEDAEKRYSVELSLQARNLLNHVNMGTPIGNLASGFFGRSVGLAGGFGGGGGGQAVGNRRLVLAASFHF